jgi:hypothetical protein
MPVTGPTLLLLVDSDGHSDATRSFLQQHPDTVVVEPLAGESDISVRTCAAINDLHPPSPVVLIAAGGAALLLPAVSRSQNASHRRISEYVLIDPELPVVTNAWPDARITVVCEPTSEASLQARLRGWDVLSPGDLDRWQVPD